MAPFLSSLVVIFALVSSISALPRRATSPTLPSSSLPAPTGCLKVIALGVGHQNYTCNATSSTYSMNMALADLYDATAFLSIDTAAIPYLPSTRLSQYTALNDNSYAADYLPVLKHIGTHYFQNATTPDFDLSGLGLFLSGKKVDSIAAPNASNINWLYLEDNGDGLSKGLSSVYRVETAGGQPPTSCSAGEVVLVPYAAEYWFYEIDS